MQPAFDPVLTNEAAVILGVSAETVRFWERTGRLPAVKTSGGVRLFNRCDIERLASEREAKRAANAREALGGGDLAEAV
jgi:excisionase family DNA binding protein